LLKFKKLTALVRQRTEFRFRYDYALGNEVRSIVLMLFGCAFSLGIASLFDSTFMTENTKMLRSMNDLKDYTIQAVDGNIGHVKDFYFDDKTWVVRYLIVVCLVGLFGTGHFLH
jgi:hypothetical protein